MWRIQILWLWTTHYILFYIYYLLIPKATRSSGDRVYSVAVATLWNKLPLSIRGAKDVNCFISSAKTHLLLNIPFQWFSFAFICLFLFLCFFLKKMFFKMNQNQSPTFRRTTGSNNSFTVIQNSRFKRANFEFKVMVHYDLWAKCTQLWPLKQKTLSLIIVAYV